MTTQTEALKLALEALERGETELRWKAITAIKEALAQPEQEHEVLGFNGWGFPIEKPNKALIEKTADHDVDCLCIDCSMVDEQDDVPWTDKAFERLCENWNNMTSAEFAIVQRFLFGVYAHPPVPTAQPKESNKDGSLCPEFWDWLPKAYNFEGDGNFTKYNMEVAFLAGKQAAQPKEPEQEPVVIQYASKAERDLYEMEDEDDTTTLQRKPLTKSQVLDLWEQTYVQRGSTGIEFARAIEAAHGIKE